MDRVQVMKRESTALGGKDSDSRDYPTTIKPQEDALEAAGLYLQDASNRDETVLISRSGSSIIVTLPGSVGIGTTPSEKLTVEGAVALDELGAAPSATTGYGKFYVKSSDGLAYFKTSGGTEYSLTASGGTPGGSDTQLQYNNGGAFGGASNLVYDDVNGRLGIGIAAPGGLLDIRSSANASTQSRCSFWLNDSSAATIYLESMTDNASLTMVSNGTSGDGESRLIFRHGATEHWGIANDHGSAEQLAFAPNPVIGGNATVSFNKAGGVSIGTTYVRETPPVNSLIVEGYVGIGTDSPDRLLSMLGTTGSNASAKITADSAGGGAYFTLESATDNVGLTLQAGGTGNDGEARLTFKQGATNQWTVGNVHVDAGQLGFAPSAASVGSAGATVSFDKAGGVSVGATYAYITPPVGGMIIEGDVGIGMDSPSEQLTVEGAVALDEITAPSATAGYGKLYVKSSDSKVYFKTAGGTEYDLTASGGGSPGGSTTQLQYNNAGAFGGIAGATWDGTTLGLSSAIEFSPLGTGSPESVRIGVNAEASAKYAVAVGRNTIARNEYGVAVGYGAYAIADAAVSLGREARIYAGGNYSVCLGYSTRSEGQSCVVIGPSSRVYLYSWQSIAIGNTAKVYNEISYGIAMGYQAEVTHANSIAFGHGAVSTEATRCTIGTIGGSYDMELQLGKGVILGGSTTSIAGAVEWDGSNFRGYTGSAWVDLDASGGSVAGSDTQLQYNNGGAFGASANLVYDATNVRLGIGTDSPDKALLVHRDTDAQVVAEIENTNVGVSAVAGFQLNAENATAVYKAYSGAATGTMGGVTLANATRFGCYSGQMIVGTQSTYPLYLVSDNTLAATIGTDQTVTLYDSLYANTTDTTVADNKGAVAIATQYSVATTGWGKKSLSVRAELTGSSGEYFAVYGEHINFVDSSTSTATTASAYGLAILMSQPSGRTWTRGYGIHVDASTNSWAMQGTVTDLTGIYVEKIEKGTNNYAIVTKGGQVVHEHAIGAGHTIRDIGSTATSTRALSYIDFADSSSSYQYAQLINLTSTGTSNSKIGLGVEVAQAANSTGILTGISSFVDAGANLNIVRAIQGGVEITGTQTTSSVYAGLFEIQCESEPTVTDAYILYAKSASVLTGAISNLYGLYVDAIDGGTNNYAIFTEEGQVVHEHAIGAGHTIRTTGSTYTNSGTLSLIHHEDATTSARDAQLTLMSSTGTAGRKVAQYNIAEQLTNASTGELVGTRSIASSAVNIPTVYGVQAIAELTQNSTTHTDVYGLQAKVAAEGTASITTAYGVDIVTGGLSDATTTTLYGLHIDDVSDGTTNYAIRTEGGQVVFDFGQLTKGLTCRGNNTTATNSDAMSLFAVDFSTSKDFVTAQQIRVANTGAGGTKYGQQILIQSAHTTATSAPGLIGLYIRPELASGMTATLTKAVGLKIDAYSASSTLVTDLYGIDVNLSTNVTADTATNAYGIRVRNVTDGDTLNYSIYTNNGLVRFGDELFVDADRVGWVSTFFNDGTNSNRYGIKVQCGDNVETGTNYFMGFYKQNDAATGYITTVSGVLTLTDASDARLKENIAPTQVNGLNVVNALPLVEFNYKNNDVLHPIGFIAQQVEDVWPQMVTDGVEDLDEDGPQKMVSRTALIPVLVKAIQELTSRLEALEAA